MVQFEIFVISPGGGRTPKTIRVAGRIPGADRFGQLPNTKFSTKAAAQKASQEFRGSISSPGQSVGVRAVPTATAEAEFKRTPTGEQIIGPAPKGKRTTRTPKEEQAVIQQAATLALANIAAGTSFASPATIAKLKAQERTQKQFVEERTLQRLAEGTTLTQFKTLREIEIERGRAVVTRARKTRKVQLRKIGAEVIFKPSKKFFGLVPTGEGVKKITKIPTETELIRELKAQKGFVTFVAPKEPERKVEISIFKPITIPAKPPPPKEKKEAVTRLEKFETRVEAQARRQREFRESKGFERIETVARFLTGGFQRRGEVRAVVPIEERGFIGRTSQAFIRDVLGFPITLGGALGTTVEKLKLTGEALTIPEIPKERIRQELFIGAPTRIVTEFKELPTEEKVAIGIFVLIAPFLGGGPVRRLLGKRVTRAKAVEELSITEKAKLERFELSVEELKGVRTEPTRLNLQEVERLSPKSAKALDRVIIRRKEELVVGGSVAQRTQIKGKSRIPEDIDIFTRGDKKALLNEIAKELKKEGVERVSVVRGKQITIEGKKAIEVKDLSLLQQNIRKVQLPFETFGSALTTTPRGVRVLRLGAQAQRKVIGGFGLEQERRRLKDIGDLPDILRSLRRLAKEKKASLSLIPERRVGPPSFLPISLLREPSSLLTGRPREPSGIGGISRLSQSPASILEAAPSEITPIKPLTFVGVPSILRPAREVPSILRPTPREFPSILEPTKEVPSILEPIKEVPPVTPPKKPPFRFGLPKRKPIKEQPGFNTFVRKGEKRGSKFVKVAENLPKNRAIKFGASAVDNFIEASFLIKSSGRKTKQRDIPRPDLRKFRGIRRGSVLPDKTIIERKGKRLDKTGELLQISFFKQQALKNRVQRQIQPPKPTKPIPEPMVPSPLMIRRRGGVMRFL